MTCCSPRIVRPPAPRARIVRVPAPARPSVARHEIAGIPGPAGPAGATGPQGYGPFGQITYTDLTTAEEDTFDAGVRKQLRFSPTATQAQDLLLPPFVGHAFFINNRLVPRALYDLYNIRINLRVMSDQAGGQLKLDVDAGSVLGPLQADDATLFEGAGVLERVTFSFSIQVLTNFLANGAAFFLLSSRPVTVVSETLLLMPASVQPE